MPDSNDSLHKLFAENSAEAAEAVGSPGTSVTRRRKRRTLRNVLIVLVSLIVLLAIGAGILYALLANSYNEIKRVSIEQDPSLKRPAVVETPPGEEPPINILLLGSDSRSNSSALSSTAENLTDFRSDAILVAQISPDRQHVTVMSIMRDNWVEIQGVGAAKINAAVAYGGLPLAVNTIENFIGARIDHVALIDFTSFKGLTDAVGGVTVYNDIAFSGGDESGAFDFPAGEVTLGGQEALAFVRERYAFADGDYQRARNQQKYLQGLTAKLLSRETLSSVDKLSGTFQAIKPYLVLDEGFDLAAAVGLGFNMRGMAGDGMTFFTSPTLGTGTYEDGQSIVLPDWNELVNVQAAFQTGTLHEYAATRAPGSELPQG